MNKIISKEHFSEHVVKLVVDAPMIALARRPGHFVIVRVGEGGERIPLTIADADVERGTITLVVQEVGVSTAKICALEPGDSFTDIVGPLGQATHIAKVTVSPTCRLLLSASSFGNAISPGFSVIGLSSVVKTFTKLSGIFPINSVFVLSYPLFPGSA